MAREEIMYKLQRNGEWACLIEWTDYFAPKLGGRVGNRSVMIFASRDFFYHREAKYTYSMMQYIVSYSLGWFVTTVFIPIQATPAPFSPLYLPLLYPNCHFHFRPLILVLWLQSSINPKTAAIHKDNQEERSVAYEGKRWPFSKPPGLQLSSSLKY